MSIRFTTYKVMAIYQYVSSSCYYQIHPLRFIICCCTLIHKKYVILLCFVFIINHNKTLLISQIIITKLFLSHKFRINPLCDIFKGHFSAADTESSTFSKSSTVQTQQTKKYAHTEQILKDRSLLEVGRSCEILLQQKGSSV